MKKRIEKLKNFCTRNKEFPEIFTILFIFLQLPLVLENINPMINVFLSSKFFYRMSLFQLSLVALLIFEHETIY